MVSQRGAESLFVMGYLLSSFVPAGLRDTIHTVYHKYMTSRNLDRHDAILRVKTTSSRNGVVAIELKVVCPPGHPTGITTAMLRLITADDLDGGRKPSKGSLKRLVRDQSTPSGWEPRQLPAGDAKHLQAVAQLYLAALKKGVHPTKTIQEWAGASRPTASRWVRQARDRGLIGEPTKPGQPGDNRRGKNNTTSNR
jgi:hypothetical protein